MSQTSGSTPADMATAAGQNGGENYLFNYGHAVADNLLSDDIEDEEWTTVDILVKATKVETAIDENGDPTEDVEDVEKKVREYYTELYRYSEFRTILDLAAAMHWVHAPTAGRHWQIYMTFNSDFAGSLTGKGGRRHL